MNEETGRPVTPERATALSKALHDGPLQSMHAARLALLIAAPLLPPQQTARAGMRGQVMSLERTTGPLR